VDHYLVSARPVNDNFYQSRVFVPGGSTSVTVNTVNNLNIPAGTAFYISVAAVDAQGHESLFAYPEYRCTRCTTSLRSTRWLAQCDGGELRGVFRSNVGWVKPINRRFYGRVNYSVIGK
jgi:hypothetical protein